MKIKLLQTVNDDVG